jgi:hypothetical protein
MRRTISGEIWEQIKVAYAAGIGLRESARNMDIPEGTVLSRAKREGLTQQIATAKLVERPKLARELAKPDAINAITPMQSTAAVVQQRAQRHVERIAGISERVVDHVEKQDPALVLAQIDDVEKLDRMARRTYGLSDGQPTGGTFALNILTGQAAIQVISKSEDNNAA